MLGKACFWLLSMQPIISKTIWETTPGKAIGKTYFEERGFTEATIKTFDLGYALEEKMRFQKKPLNKGTSRIP